MKEGNSEVEEKKSEGEKSDDALNEIAKTQANPKKQSPNTYISLKDQENHESGKNSIQYQSDYKLSGSQPSSDKSKEGESLDNSLLKKINISGDNLNSKNLSDGKEILDKETKNEGIASQVSFVAGLNGPKNIPADIPFEREYDNVIRPLKPNWEDESSELNRKLNFMIHILEKIDPRFDSLEKEVKSLDTKVNTLGTTVNALDTKVNTLGTTVNSLKDDMALLKDEMSRRLTNLETEIKTLKNLYEFLCKQNTDQQTNSIVVGNMIKSAFAKIWELKERISILEQKDLKYVLTLNDFKQELYSLEKKFIDLQNGLPKNFEGSNESSLHIMNPQSKEENLDKKHS